MAYQYWQHDPDHERIVRGFVFRAFGDLWGRFQSGDQYSPFPGPNFNPFVGTIGGRWATMPIVAGTVKSHEELAIPDQPIFTGLDEKLTGIERGAFAYKDIIVRHIGTAYLAHCAHHDHPPHAGRDDECGISFFDMLGLFYWFCDKGYRWFDTDSPDMRQNQISEEIFYILLDTASRFCGGRYLAPGSR